MMNNMRGGDDLPDVDEAEDVRIIYSIFYLYSLNSCSLTKNDYKADVKSVSRVHLICSSDLFCLRMSLQIVMMRVSIYEPL